MKDIKHVQLEASAFISDVDFQLMDAEQRGVYCSIIFYLYANGGELQLDNSDITLLSDKTNTLAMISNCAKTGHDWKQVWNKIAHKFQINGNILTHKRVTQELKKAAEYRKRRSEAGKKGMKARWADNKDITNISKVNINIYTSTDFVNAGAQVGLTQQESIECYEYYKGLGFEFKKDYPIRDPQDACVRWRNNRYRFEKQEQKKGPPVQRLDNGKTPQQKAREKIEQQRKEYEKDA